RVMPPRILRDRTTKDNVNWALRASGTRAARSGGALRLGFLDNPHLPVDPGPLPVLGAEHRAGEVGHVPDVGTVLPGRWPLNSPDGLADVDRVAGGTD